MRYKEFKEKIEDWGEKYNYKPVVGDEFNYIYIEFEGDGYIDLICAIHKSIIFTIDLNWGLYRNFSDDAKKDLFKVATEFAATKPEDREDKKDNLDLIIHKLKEIQIKAEGVMSWEDIAIIWTDIASWTDVVSWMGEEIEKNQELINTLKDIIIDLEEYKEASER